MRVVRDSIGRLNNCFESACLCSVLLRNCCGYSNQQCDESIGSITITSAVFASPDFVLFFRTRAQQRGARSRNGLSDRFCWLISINLESHRLAHAEGENESGS